MSHASLVFSLTMLGVQSDLAGIRRTSSNVSPSLTNLFEKFVSSIKKYLLIKMDISNKNNILLALSQDISQNTPLENKVKMGNIFVQFRE